MRKIGSTVLLSTLLTAGFAFAAPAAAHAAQAATVISPKIPLNARSGPAVWNPSVRRIAHGAPIAIECQVKGQRITEGTTRVTDAWNRLSDGTYVSDAWISRAAAVPTCTAAPPAAPPAPAAQPAAAPVAAAAATTSGAVASGSIPLKARTGPAHREKLVAALPNGTALSMVCQQRGEKILGTMRITDMWNRLPNGTYVSDAYVRRGATPPRCETLAAPAAAVVPGAPAGAAVAATAGWVHPLPGYPARPGFRTANNPYHIGVDLMAFTGTPIRAAAAGTVVEVVCNIELGRTCDEAGSASVRGCGWYIKLQHVNRVSTIYCHMVRRSPLQVGQAVAANQVIGYVGSSGNSSAPHLHFEVHIDAPPTGPHNAVDPIPFMKARGVPLDR